MAVTKPGLLLAHAWDGEQDVTGWWVSEKLDGVRAYWDGKKLVSRLGNQFFAPKWFTTGWPKTPMDGELWMGRGLFQKTISCVRKLKPVDAEWKRVKYVVFDVPTWGDPFEVRTNVIGRLVREFIDSSQFKSGIFGGKHSPLLGLAQLECRGSAHLFKLLNLYEQQGAEGLMLRQPASLYVPKRSNTLLKVKTFQTAEGKVIGHEPGKGKHKGRLGALVVSLPGYKSSQLGNDRIVCVGTGFSDAERENPPKVGSIVTYRFQELTDGGIPRFPTYVGVRRVS